MSRYYTVKEVAQILHRHPRTIYRWLDEGYLHGKKVRDGWLILEAEMERLIRDPFEEECESERKTKKVSHAGL